MQRTGLLKSNIDKMAKVFLLGAIFTSSFAVMPAVALEKSRFTIGMSQYPSSLHPGYDEMVAKSLVLGTALRPLTAYDAAWNPVCMLCTLLPSFENGRAVLEKRADGTEGIAATYTLKAGLKWGDGAPVTTADVVFAWEVGKHPASGIGNGEFFAKDIADITVTDAQTFTIHFAKVKCDFAAVGDFYPLPAHLERKIFEKDPKNYRHQTLYNTDPTQAGLYNGPYRISKIENGVSVAVTRNAAWSGPAPVFDTLVFRTIENSAALAANLQSGGVDYIAGELGLSLDQALALEKRLSVAAPEKYEVVYKTGLTYEHIDLNLDSPEFQDIRVRQALMYGMDRESFNRQIFSGRQPVALGSVNPQDTVYSPEVTGYPYDPDKAAALLAQAGWQLRADGVRYNDAGQKLVVHLATTAGNSTRELIGQAIQADWKKIGVTTVIENAPARVLFGDIMRERKFKGGVMFAWISSPRNIPKTTLYSTMIPAPENNYAGQNYAGYKNAAMDRIIDDLDVVCEAGENRALWQQLQKLYADDLPALPLYYRADAFFIPAGLEGVVPTGHLHPSTLWVENWRIEP